jgi:hypothetical protein
LPAALREDGQAGGDPRRSSRDDLDHRDPADERIGDREGLLLGPPGQHHRELVSADAERLAAAPQARRDELEQAVPEGESFTCFIPSTSSRQSASGFAADSAASSSCWSRS